MPSRYAAAYALAVEPMSPRLPSATTISPAVRAYAQTFSKDCIPSAPSASKNASWGLTPTAYGATASITPRQNRVNASAASARPSPASPASSSGSSSGTGSSPTSNWLRLRSTASASLSPNARTFVPRDAASSSCTMASEYRRRRKERGRTSGGPRSFRSGVATSRVAGAALDRLLELATGRELRDCRRGDLHPLGWVPRVDALPCSARLRRELAEARESDLATST